MGEQSLADTIPLTTPAATFYLGLGSGDLGRRIGRIPLIGIWLERTLTKRAKATHSPAEKIPGPVTALVVFAFSLIRYRRFLKMKQAWKSGMTIVTDRYPQVGTPGKCDGPGLSKGILGSGFVAALARKEHQLYERMAELTPSLVILLDVDPATAFRRKPDHDPFLLSKKVKITRKLQFGKAAHHKNRCYSIL